jgi:hypothetical protein
MRDALFGTYFFLHSIILPVHVVGASDEEKLMNLSTFRVASLSSIWYLLEPAVKTTGAGAGEGTGAGAGAAGAGDAGAAEIRAATQTSLVEILVEVTFADLQRLQLPLSEIDTNALLYRISFFVLSLMNIICNQPCPAHKVGSASSLLVQDGWAPVKLGQHALSRVPDYFLVAAHNSGRLVVLEKPETILKSVLDAHAAAVTKQNSQAQHVNLIFDALKTNVVMVEDIMAGLKTKQTEVDDAARARDDVAKARLGKQKRPRASSSTVPASHGGSVPVIKPTEQTIASQLLDMISKGTISVQDSIAFMAASAAVSKESTTTTTGTLAEDLDAEAA